MERNLKQKIHELTIMHEDSPEAGMIIMKIAEDIAFKMQLPHANKQTMLMKEIALAIINEIQILNTTAEEERHLR